MLMKYTHSTFKIEERLLRPGVRFVLIERLHSNLSAPHGSRIHSIYVSSREASAALRETASQGEAPDGRVLLS